MTTTPTSGAADLPEALRSIQRFEVVDCIDDKHVPAVIPKPHGPWVRYEDHIAALAAGQATAAQPAAPARDLAAVINGAADKLDAAVRCHPNAVDTLIHEALEILDGDREHDATPASRGQAPAGATLPDGWVPLMLTHEGQYPEEVAYGPQIMMDRLGKWLGKYFAQAAQADSVQEDAARYRWLREGNDAKHGAAWHVAVNLYGCEWDAAIDAAMNKGATQ